MSRRALDFYETSPWQVDALVDYLPELRGVIWCPCVGDGSLLRRLRKQRPDLGPFVTVDIDPRRRAMAHADMTRPSSWAATARRHGRPDWVVENVPFEHAFEIAQCALAWAKRGVVLMTRISFAEPTIDRGPWLRNHPRALSIALERYSFTGDGATDSATTAWQVWTAGPLRHRGNVSAYGYRVRPRRAPRPKPALILEAVS